MAAGRTLYFGTHTHTRTHAHATAQAQTYPRGFAYTSGVAGGFCYKDTTPFMGSFLIFFVAPAAHRPVSSKTPSRLTTFFFLVMTWDSEQRRASPCWTPDSQRIWIQLLYEWMDGPSRGNTWGGGRAETLHTYIHSGLRRQVAVLFDINISRVLPFFPPNTSSCGVINQ